MFHEFKEFTTTMKYVVTQTIYIDYWLVPRRNFRLMS